MPPHYRLRLLCAAAAVAATVAGMRAADDPLAATLSRMDAAAASFRNLTADIRETSHTAVINEDTVDSGILYVKRPKPSEVRMRIEIRPPNPKQVEFSGHTARIYYPKSNTVEEYDLGKNKGMVDQFLLLGFGSSIKDLENAYTIRLGGPETVAGEKTMRLELTPKSPDVLSHLKKVDLWISDQTGVAVQQKLYEPGGDYWLANYTNVKLNNPNMPDSVFRLNLPKDVRRERPQK